MQVQVHSWWLYLLQGPRLEREGGGRGTVGKALPNRVCLIRPFSRSPPRLRQSTLCKPLPPVTIHGTFQSWDDGDTSLKRADELRRRCFGGTLASRQGLEMIYRLKQPKLPLSSRFQRPPADNQHLHPWGLALGNTKNLAKHLGTFSVIHNTMYVLW